MHSINEMMQAGYTTAHGVRHWEAQGLLGSVQRSKRNERQYTDAQIDLARIIAAAQFGGWPLDQIKQMLDAWRVDETVYEAICTRLSDQIHVAMKLLESLPMSPKTEQIKKWDL